MRTKPVNITKYNHAELPKHFQEPKFGSNGLCAILTILPSHSSVMSNQLLLLVLVLTCSSWGESEDFPVFFLLETSGLDPRAKMRGR